VPSDDVGFARALLLQTQKAHGEESIDDGCRDTALHRFKNGAFFSSARARSGVDTLLADMTANPNLNFRYSPWTFDERTAAELEELTDGAIVVDAAGSIVFANAVAVAMHGRLIMGVLPDDYSPMHGLFTEDGRPYPSTDLPLARAAMFGETVVGAKWRIRRPDGTSVAAMGDAMPLTDMQGSQSGAILLFHQTSS